VRVRVRVGVTVTVSRGCLHLLQRNYHFSMLASLCVVVTLMLGLAFRTRVNPSGEEVGGTVSYDVLAVLLIIFQVLPLLGASYLTVRALARRTAADRAHARRQARLPAALRDSAPGVGTKLVSASWRSRRAGVERKGMLKGPSSDAPEAGESVAGVVSKNARRAVPPLATIKSDSTLCLAACI
jgi:hypothetical protein